MASETTPDALTKKIENSTGGAVGAGLVLIVLPSVALYYGIDRMSGMPIVGLPILAIFGIMILFGALALISTLFSRLGLSDSSQALALPEGSIRAAIALSLIVLFAIISIMLYQSISKPYVITGLAEPDKTALLNDPSNRVIAVVPECRTKPADTAAAAPDCAPADLRYSVHLRQPPGQESTDLAKQLLILIGTLMTSVTSFYFASRTAEPRRTVEPPAPAVEGSATRSPIAGPLLQPAQADDLATERRADESHMDGCEVPVVDPTPDEDLPASRGGVA